MINAIVCKTSFKAIHECVAKYPNVEMFSARTLIMHSPLQDIAFRCFPTEELWRQVNMLCVGQKIEVNEVIEELKTLILILKFKSGLNENSGDNILCHGCMEGQ